MRGCSLCDSLRAGACITFSPYTQPKTKVIQTTSSFPNAAISEDESILADISEPSKNIAIYQRNIDQLGRELHQLTEQKIEFRASGSVADILSQLRDYSQEYLPPSPSSESHP